MLEHHNTKNKILIRSIEPNSNSILHKRKNNTRLPNFIFYKVYLTISTG